MDATEYIIQMFGRNQIRETLCLSYFIVFRLFSLREKKNVKIN